MTSYEKQRELEVRRVGLDVQMQAESIADRWQSETRVDRVDSATGKRKRMRQSLAAVTDSRGETHSVRRTFAMPDFPPGFWDGVA